MANFDLFFKQKFDLDLGKVDMSLTLRNDQVSVFLGVPLLLHAVCSCIVSNLRQVLVKRKLADLSGNQDALFSFLDQVKVELLLSRDNLLFNQVLLGEHFELWLFVFDQLLDCLVQ